MGQQPLLFPANDCRVLQAKNQPRDWQHPEQA
jgi:hypothetical protein